MNKSKMMNIQKWSGIFIFKNVRAMTDKINLIFGLSTSKPNLKFELAKNLADVVTTNKL